MTGTKNNVINGTAAPSRGRFVNTGNGPTFQAIDIGHPEYVAMIEPDTAFWSLIQRESRTACLSEGGLLKSYAKKSKQFAKEMNSLRFGLKPSAVYFNPTEQCN
ncbi:MAG: peptide-modifying radical SAM enzyme CbpB, partial [Proteobacteria bacterium]|nr:peptide-modifying radical SAM enzyme CbpB [Pseudomonadota bacterium]